MLVHPARADVSDPNTNSTAIGRHLLGPPVTLAWWGADALLLYVCETGIIAATAGLAYTGWRMDTSGIWMFWAFVSLIIWSACGFRALLVAVSY